MVSGVVSVAHVELPELIESCGLGDDPQDEATGMLYVHFTVSLNV